MSQGKMISYAKNGLGKCGENLAFQSIDFYPLLKAIRKSAKEEIENERKTQRTKTANKTKFTKESETAIWRANARIAQSKTAKPFTAKTKIGS